MRLVPGGADADRWKPLPSRGGEPRLSCGKFCKSMITAVAGCTRSETPPLETARFVHVPDHDEPSLGISAPPRQAPVCVALPTEPGVGPPERTMYRALCALKAFGAGM